MTDEPQQTLISKALMKEMLDVLGDWPVGEAAIQTVTYGALFLSYGPKGELIGRTPDGHKFRFVVRY